ncbi:aminodeoxychorismate lyase [Frigoribacterium sp. 2-23]|uniref:aminodeoxychorismate lyase n=1 Tax=Frigoribacterium sp. 2-23 TaxID=3415006 RepID=UPI003C6F6E31
MSLPALFLLRHDATAPAEPDGTTRSHVASVEQADPSDPQVSVADLAATRGDGIFESIGVFGGRAQAVDAHVARLARSAALLDLPVPDEAAWRDAIDQAVAAGADDEAFLIKLVLTRGDEGGDRPTAWAHAFVMPDHTAEQTAGIRAVTLDRGYRSDVAETSPWLLQGAKTLSYAVNLAALREARRRGADDVVFVSSDAVVLEGPNSTVVARLGSTLVTTPPSLGVLEGTTQASLFEHAIAVGLSTEYRAMTVDEIRAADALWLLSSGRLLAPVVELDGRAVSTDPEFTADAVAFLRARHR